MHSDVVDLRDFYATSLGQVAVRMIRRRIRLIWPDLAGMRLLGMGYAVPYLRPFREEAWRVLTGAGRILIVVPNRRGIWARLDRTPFGLGHPYTPGQLSRLLREEMFTPVQSATALFIPPVRTRMMLGSAAAWEKLGERWFTRFAGVAMI